jgi:hypothetical protein
MSLLSLLPEDIRYLIAQYFDLPDLHLLYQNEVFAQKTLKTEGIWKFYWTEYIGGPCENYVFRGRNFYDMYIKWYYTRSKTQSEDILKLSTDAGHHKFIERYIFYFYFSFESLKTAYETTHHQDLKKVIYDNYGEALFSHSYITCGSSNMVSGFYQIAGGSTNYITGIHHRT